MNMKLKYAPYSKELENGETRPRRLVESCVVSYNNIGPIFQVINELIIVIYNEFSYFLFMTGSRGSLIPWEKQRGIISSLVSFKGLGIPKKFETLLRGVQCRYFNQTPQFARIQIFEMLSLDICAGITQIV